VGTGTSSPAARGGLGPAPAGRPPSNIGKYLIRPTAEADTGWEMINSDPDILRQVHRKYLKAGMLPPALQPKYLRKPEVMESGPTGRATNISKGWRKPRSRSG
jgi:hypothetical protein